MAKDKKGFILYADQKALFDQLPNDKAGELIKFIMAYVNDENPITEDLIINLAFTPIKQQLKRDLQKFEETKVSRSIAGKAGANKRWQNIANDSKRIQTIAKIADNVNVNVNDNVIDNNTIPTKDIFVAYGLDKLSDVSVDALKLKYEAWLSNNWCTNKNGKEVKIKNWKTTLNNTLVYLPKEPKQQNEDDYMNHVMKQINKNK